MQKAQEEAPRIAPIEFSPKNLATIGESDTASPPLAQPNSFRKGFTKTPKLSIRPKDTIIIKKHKTTTM
jgi:hypothetical protein